MLQMIDVSVASNGRLVLPKAIRTALGVEAGGKLTIALEDGDVRILSAPQRVALAQAYYRAHVVHDFTSDDFLVERKREALEEVVKNQANQS
jgi:AbrB family looped-hinge helix DNA binding protein